MAQKDVDLILTSSGQADQAPGAKDRALEFAPIAGGSETGDFPNGQDPGPPPPPPIRPKFEPRSSNAETRGLSMRMIEA